MLVDIFHCQDMEGKEETHGGGSQETILRTSTGRCIVLPPLL